MTEEVKKTPTRSEREAAIKDKAGLVIVVMALFMAVTTYFANQHSGAVLKNMLKATDTYAFYQAKSIKGSIAEGQLEDAKAKKDQARIEKLEAKIARDEAARHSPWLTFASMAFQLAIVLLSASIIAVNEKMYKVSEGVAVIGVLLLSQGIWLWF